MKDPKNQNSNADDEHHTGNAPEKSLANFSDDTVDGKSIKGGLDVKFYGSDGGKDVNGNYEPQTSGG